VSRTARLLLFGVGAAGFGVVLLYGLAGLPAFGHYRGVYGRVLDGIGVTERHATDLVTALNFDFRAFDTLGEEFILFASVLGVVLILRQLRDEHERPNQEEADEHQLAGASDALRALALVLVPSLLAVGVYIVVHGQITPGGGFQGGVILATGPLAVFLAGRYLRMRIIAPIRSSRSATPSGRSATDSWASAGSCSSASSSRISCRWASPATSSRPVRSTSRAPR
jgi:multicomponent Na+:H+ antiporter subunit B